MTNDPVILFVKPGAISSEDKAALQGASVIVIEIDDVANAKLVRANSELSAGALLRAACSAIKKDCYSESRDAFAWAICEAVEAQVKAKP